MMKIEIENLTIDYSVGFLRKRRWRALDSLTLGIESGEVVGLLGPNGAGKTTLFRALIGLIRPTAGRILVDGGDHLRGAWRAGLGYLPEQPSFYENLTAAEFLIYGGELGGLSRAKARGRAGELLERLGLAEAAAFPLRRFSKGMRQRVGLAQALINDPALLLLDEPMSGLDPFGRRLVREIMAEARAAGKTILFSSHNLGDIGELTDRVAVIARGRLIAHGAVSTLVGDQRSDQSALEEWFLREVDGAESMRGNMISER